MLLFCKTAMPWVGPVALTQQEACMETWTASRPEWGRVVAALALLVAAALLLVPPASGQSPSKVALVVGNAAYEHASSLANPKNDAEDIAAILEGLGFAVEKATDLDYRAFTERVVRFSKRTKGAEAALLYYAGHGLQMGGDNYLLPVDVTLEDEMQLRFHSVALNDVLRGMRSSANLVFLDACRDNPFARGRAGAGRSTAVDRGLARVEVEKKDRDSHGGTFIAFATAAGKLASDGEGRNSPFTAALKKHIGTPGLVISQVMNLVRKELASLDQKPWDTSSLVDDFYFSARPSAALPTSSSTVPSARRLDPAEELWSQIKASNDAGRFERFMRTFPNSPLVPAARARLEELADRLTVQTVPPNALVQITDPEMPYQGGMDIHAGRYEVTVEAQGYAPFKQYLSVKGNTNYRISLCKLEEQTKTICKDVEVTQYRTKKREPSYHSKTIEYTTLELWDRYTGGGRTYVSSWRRWDNSRRLKWEGQLRSGLETRIRKWKRGVRFPYLCDSEDSRAPINGSLSSLSDYSCSMHGVISNDRCEITINWECDQGIIREPYTTTLQKCSDEKSVRKVCPENVLTKLR